MDIFDGDEKGYVAEEKPKQKRKKLTDEEKRAALEAKIEVAAEKARQRAMKAQMERENKRTKKKTERVTAKQGIRDRLYAAVMTRARQDGISLNAEKNVKIPEKLPKEEHLNKYYTAAKKRYYTRHKDKPTSAQRAAMRIAEEEGIPIEYFKNTRSKKTSEAILAAVRKKFQTAKQKKDKTAIRSNIMQMISDNYGLNEDDALKVVCVRKKKNAVKP